MGSTPRTLASFFSVAGFAPPPCSIFHTLVFATPASQPDVSG